MTNIEFRINNAHTFGTSHPEHQLVWDEDLKQKLKEHYERRVRELVEEGLRWGITVNYPK